MRYTRFLVITLSLFIVFIGLTRFPGSSSATPTTYYFSSTGSDTNSGLSSSTPWKTFGKLINSSRSVRPGDTLILVNSTFTTAVSGNLTINCNTNATSGTAIAPITIKALNERKALILSDGSSEPIHMENCSYWNLEGLYLKNSNNSGASSDRGDVIQLTNAHHINLKRLLSVHPNTACPNRSLPYCNAHGISVIDSDNLLVEDSEVYDYHRHGISIYRSHHVTLRRNYINDRNAQGNNSSNGNCYIFYGSHDDLAENNICDDADQNGSFKGGNNAASMAYDGILGGSHNLQIGEIINGTTQSTWRARGFDGGHGPVYDTMKNSVVINTFYQGLYARGAATSTVENVTFFGNGRSNTPAIQADEEKGALDNGGTWSCSRHSGKTCSMFIDNALIFGSSAGIDIESSTHKTWKVEYSNVSSGKMPSSYLSTQILSNNRSLAPTGMGTNSCLLWVPNGSNMKGAGKGGADIGANILYEYKDGVETNVPLWDVTRAGQFAGCGAIVQGVNDVASSSCSNVHMRLNVGSAYGCAFPAGYGNTSTSSVFEAPYIMSPVNASGTLSEFNTASSAIIHATSGGNTGDYRFLWDASNLYIRATVQDSDLRATTLPGTATSSLYNEDGVEIYIDRGRERGAPDINDFKFVVNLRNAQRVERAGLSASVPFISQVRMTGTLNDTAQDTSYIIFLKIPWINIGGAPVPSSTMGLDISLNERDTSLNSQTAWSNTTSGSFNDSAGWGSIVLASTSTAPLVEIFYPSTNINFTSLSSTTALSARIDAPAGVRSVIWNNTTTGVSGSASLTLYGWFASGILLRSGVNQITYTVIDELDRIATDSIAITYDTSPRAAYSFSQINGGTIVPDISGHGMNGIVGGGATGVAGKNGQGLLFDGVNDYVSVPISEDPTAYTLEAWVKPTSTINQNILLRTSSNTPTLNWSHQLRIINGKFEHYTYDSIGGKVVRGTTPVVSNTWYHVVGTAENNNFMHLYVNGVEEGIPTPIEYLWAGGNQYLIGSNAGNATFGSAMAWFSGVMDDVRIYHRALSPQEILNDYATPLAGREMPRNLANILDSLKEVINLLTSFFRIH